MVRELMTLFQAYNKGNITDRVRKLNSIYHTRLSNGSLNKIENWLEENGDKFENRVRRKGDYNVVMELVSCEGKKNSSWFIFSTKYCGFINPEVYPIYDSLIAVVLERLNADSAFYSTEPLSLEKTVKNKCDYDKFVGVIDSFKNEFHLKGCSYKEIDKFLWLVGKNI